MDKTLENLNPLIVYEYKDELNKFKELEMTIPLLEFFDSDKILLFVDFTRYRVWIWHGSNTTTRMKFIAAKLAPSIRDRYGIGFTIGAVDEGNETLGFKIMAGLVEAVDYTEAQTGPTYEGTEEDLELLESLSREKILLLLEKAGVPEGYERKMVIVKNQIFGYKKYDRNSSPLDLPKAKSESKLYCKYCGSILTKEQKFCPVCGNMVI